MPNHHLPTKTCAHCKREFAWRKKWERDWASVKYCSRKCAAAAKAVDRGYRHDATIPALQASRRNRGQ